MLYRYQASDKEGAITEGEFEASNKSEVVNFLEKKNLIPILVEEKSAVKGISLSASLAIFERVTPIDQIILVRNLSATMRSGLSIVESLDILIADATKDIMRKILTQAKINLQNGQPLSATFTSFKKFFPVIFIGMLKAGESAGRLDSIFEELGKHLTREYNLAKKIKSALAYPLILLIASIAVVSLLLFFVLPRLTKTFKQSGVELPLITKIIVAVSNALTYSPVLDLTIIGALVWFFIYFRKTDVGRKIFLKILLSIPIVRDLVKKVALVRFTRTLGSLISSGTSIVESLNLSAESVGNDYYKKAILESVKQVKTGVSFSKTLGSSPELFPHFLNSLVVVGERTGTLEKILKNFAEFYDEEIDNNLKDLTTFLEPVLLLLMGIVVGSIALSVLLPIYKLVGKFI